MSTANVSFGRVDGHWQDIDQGIKGVEIVARCDGQTEHEDRVIIGSMHKIHLKRPPLSIDEMFIGRMQMELK